MSEALVGIVVLDFTNEFFASLIGSVLVIRGRPCAARSVS